ncbi:MAG TPA: DUF2608 domain-containing protein [Bdellovibrionales bacterium]|nr:DUF2608 domain-containing protein [Bdellovibrionales bacterium]
MYRTLARIGLLFALSALPGCAKAEIRETKSMAEALSTVDQDTLLVLDTDNTLTKTKQMLGGEAWVPYVLKSRAQCGVEAGLSEDEANARGFTGAKPVWETIQTRGFIEPVEPGTPALLKSLQARGVKMMVLSGAVADFLEGRKQALGHVGIAIDQSAPVSGTVVVAENVVYKQGIMLTSFSDKGDALVAFFDKTGYRPKRVVFVDDYPKFNQQIHRALTAARIEHLAYRYGAADSTHADFDPKIAEIQLETFLASGAVLSDAQARELLSAGRTPARPPVLCPAR